MINTLKVKSNSVWLGTKENVNNMRRKNPYKNAKENITNSTTVSL